MTMIRMFLYLSTAHLTPETRDALFADELDVLTWHENGEGASCIVYVCDDPGALDANDENLPDDLMACIRFARAHCCDRINFDRDAEQVFGLKVYEDA
jgi:hypothetical protein